MRINPCTFFYSFVLATICFIFAPSYVYASSAAAYGNKVVHSHSAPSREVAVQKALESCSAADTHCKILVKCSKTGFGAVATERVGGLISAIGATCAAESATKAKEEALSRCSTNNLRDNCQLRTQWHDEATAN